MIQKAFEFAQKAPEQSLQNVLLRVISLYGAWSLDKHMSVLYQGGCASGPDPANFVKQGILDLCDKIKPDAIALVDAIAPNDFFISVLGKSDGQVYFIFLRN